MARRQHYSPQLGRFLVCVLYHEARRRGKPMTALANQLLESALAGSEGWREAEQAMVLAEASTPYRPSPLKNTIHSHPPEKAASR